MIRYILHAAFCVIFVAAFFWNAPAAAHHKKNHGQPGYSGEHKGDYKKGRKHPKKYGKHGGPPPWAPAHGYRAKHRYKSGHDGRTYNVAPADLITLPDTGIGTCNRETLGALLGAAVGGATGAKLGTGDGKILASIGGAVLGVLIGGNIGRAMDQVDQHCIGQVLERAPTGQSVVWQDAERNAEYDVTPTRTYQSPSGQYCREYETKIVIDGRVENAYGTACRQPDGSWQKAP